jgi:hypothetical protein
MMSAIPISAEFFLTQNPDRLIMQIDGMTPTQARAAANSAVKHARRRMPKMSGASASRLSPVYGIGYFGVAWQDSYVWYQENGIKPFTMTSLQGKTIPMWIDDPTGQERAKNPKAKTRVTLSGKTQVLIFRKVARVGDMTTKRKRVKGSNPPEFREVQVPKHWPGAPGRIAKRQAEFRNFGPPPGQNQVVSTGKIALGNIGVWWRHPGLQPRFFLNGGITQAAMEQGFLPTRIYVADRASWKVRSPSYVARYGGG